MFITQNPPRTLSEQASPAFPYPQYKAIHHEDDVPLVLQDQVERLPTDFDRCLLKPFFRFVWLLNTSRYRTLQGYLGLSGGNPNQFGCDVLMGPLTDDGKSFIIDLASIEVLSNYLCECFLPLASLYPAHASVTFTSVPTKFGLKPDPMKKGFCVSIRVIVTAENQDESTRLWSDIVSAMGTRLENTK